MDAADDTRDEKGQGDKDSDTRSEHGSGGGHGPPETGERGDPQRDSESGDPVEAEPGDIAPADQPGQGKDTHGG